MICVNRPKICVITDNLCGPPRNPHRPCPCLLRPCTVVVVAAAVEEEGEEKEEEDSEESHHAIRRWRYMHTCIHAFMNFKQMIAC